MTYRPAARIANLVVQKSGSETLIYNLKTNKAYCLNETSAVVWELCDGNRSSTEIRDEMSKRIKTAISDEFVSLALYQLHKDGLLSQKGTLSDYFGGLSRREIIRKVGFTSIAVLPVVSSLVAPKSSMAQSTGIPLLANCFDTTNTRTCSTGLVCAVTVDIVAGVGGSSTGMFQCCVMGNATPGSTFCSSLACSTNNSSCCSGNAMATTALPACVAPTSNTCICA